MSSLNKVILIGNLGSDPEVNQITPDRKVCNMILATTERWKDKKTGESKERTEWHRIVIYKPGLISIAKQYLKKGSKIYIEGTLYTRKWHDKEGNDKYITEIIMKGSNCSLTMLKSKNKETNNQPTKNNQSNKQPYQLESQTLSNNNNFIDDEIPF
ncbi:MAG: single-stranded DNA-binding protein [Promethearchaeota archaeon]